MMTKISPRDTILVIDDGKYGPRGTILIKGKENIAGEIIS